MKQIQHYVGLTVLIIVIIITVVAVIKHHMIF